MRFIADMVQERKQLVEKAESILNEGHYHHGQGGPQGPLSACTLTKGDETLTI